MRRFTLLFLGLTLSCTIGCGGGGNGSSTNTGGGGGTNGGSQSFGISGAYEFVATSGVDGSTTLIEANLSASGAQTSATGPSQVQTATYVNGLWYVNGACNSSSPGQNSVAGTASGSSITLTFNEGGNVFTGQGTVTGTTVTGTYSGTNANCSDSGTFTGKVVAPLAGTYAGALSFSLGSDQVTATLTEGSGNALTFQTTLSGVDNGTFTFTGSAVANVMFVSGSVNGSAFSLFGYFDKDGTYTGTPNSIAVFDDQTLKYLGTLTVPVAQLPTGTNYTTCTDLNGNNQAVPNWQSSLFTSNYQPAIKALVSHYQGNASVQYIRIGLGRGDEVNLPTGWNDSSTGACYGGFTTNWKYTVGGDSSFTWNAYLQSMVQYEAGLSSPTPLLVSITPVNGTSSNVVPDFIAPLAVSNGTSYGNQGLQASDIAGIASLTCGADWCGLFKSSPPQIAELQTLGQSCPTGTTCVNNLSALTGPLDPLLPVAIEGGANDIEIYTADWEIAYDPTNPLNPSVGAAYSAAIAAASASAHMQVLFPDPSDSAVASYLIPNAVVTGAVIQVDWSDFDLGNGNYNFAITDAAVAPWVNGGKKVALVLQNTTYSAGDCGSGGGVGSNGQSGTGNCAVPPYMWTVLK